MERTYVIVMVEAGLENLPPPLARDRKALRLARRYRVRPQQLLLDVSVFYEQMRRLGIDASRGRPDIVHMFLLATSYSPLALKGRLKTYVHTRQGRLIEVEPGTRPPKNQFQFYKLMMQLLSEGRVPPDSPKPLMRIYNAPRPADVLKAIGAEKPVLLHEKGRSPKCNELWGMTAPSTVFVVGGFPHGDYGREWLSLSSDRIRVASLPVDAWIAVDRLVACLERGLGISL